MNWTYKHKWKSVLKSCSVILQDVQKDLIWLIVLSPIENCSLISRRDQL